MNEKIVLILTPSEGRVLHEILNRIGGDPNGARGFAESIRQKLLPYREILTDMNVCVKLHKYGNNNANSFYFVEPGPRA